ncbi:NAD(P)-binding protein [Auricularia subglabra TFB-10046 SS5]|uniref:NAD(P)-binding protein n=1 Tax=Auricularia subglabra (strain TFB-10046 / SS5) TaxID=717982 RepID=J0WUC9_AURST|nr:NAD(P)-binding protein [Auricularia subglabra TFB-10046 SS5]
MSHTFGDSTTADEVVSAFSAQVKGRVFLITGPSPKGIGEATALSLARGHPSTLILVGRNPAKYEPVAAAIRAIDANVSVKIYGIDLASLSSVREGARKIVTENERIDVVINNAGAVTTTLEKTVDGIEFGFAACHVGHFLLTNLLLPLLRKSEAPRVVNLTSNADIWSSGDYDDYNFDNAPYSYGASYGLAKLANIHFAQYLAKHGNGLLSFSVHPGTVFGTSFLDVLPEPEIAQLKTVVQSMGAREKTHAEGAATTLVAALDPALKDHKGAYLADCQVKPLESEAAKREDLPEKLWRLSETLVKESFTFVPKTCCDRAGG